jgi:DNA-binding beta-propeller fold protein YncE
MKPIHNISAALAILIIGSPAHDLAAASSSAADADPPKLGKYQSTIDNFSRPAAVDIRPDGTIAVADSVDHAIRILRPDRTLHSTLRGTENTPLIAPAGITWTSANTLVVTDAATHRLLIFTLPESDQNDLAPSIATLSPPVELYQPAGVDFHNDTLAVADAGNHRIVIANPNTTSILGQRGDATGHFKRPLDVAFDDLGRLYVADTGNQRIQRFRLDHKTNTYEFDTTFGEWGAFPGLFAEPTAIDIAGNRIFVADAINHRIQIFTLDGEFLDLWGMHALIPRQGEGRIHYPNGFAVSPDGTSAVVAEAFEQRIQTFTTFGPDEQRDAPLPLQKGQQSHFGNILAHAGERLAVWEPETRSIMIFSARYEVPILITQFGGAGSKFGKFGNITAMMLEHDGALLHTVDPDHERIQTFDIAGAAEDMLRYDPLLATFGVSRPLPSISPDGATLDITAIIALDHSHKALLDARGKRIIVVDHEWKPLRTVTLPDDLIHPCDLDRATLDQPYWIVADDIDATIHVLTDDGNTAFVRETGADNLPLIRPSFIATSPMADLIIVDSQSANITLIDAEGNAGNIGTTGGEVGQLYQPGDVAFLHSGNLVVVDYGNHRAQIFTPGGKWLVSFGVGRAYTHRNPPRPTTTTPNESDIPDDPKPDDSNTDR